MPEVPPVPRVAESIPASQAAAPLDRRVAQVFSARGPLARSLRRFEPRSAQVEMAQAVARVFDGGGVLLVEAGTGTGKTLAYLAPAVLSRQRAIISTGTKNLQEQIYFKDIPALRKALGIPFTATLMKGRANYLCLHRLEQADESGALIANDVFLPMIREWAARTDTGDRAELEDLPEDLPFWNEVAATAETCLGTECRRYDECFVTRMRRRAAASDVVIVNHHLLCADAAVRHNSTYGEVIPSCAQIVLDEAHQLEDVATQYFGYSVSYYRIEELARDVEHLVAAGLVQDLQTRELIGDAVGRLREGGRAFFTALAAAHGAAERGRHERSAIRTTADALAGTHDEAAQLTGALDRVEAALAFVPEASIGTDAPAPGRHSTPARDSREPATPHDEDGGPGPSDDREAIEDRVAGLVRRAATIRDELRFLVRASDPGYVYFVELRGRGVFFRAAPIDVSAVLRELLLERMRTVVLTSATLTVDGSFGYVRSRLGVTNAAELRLPSEFDFSRQAILYLPPRMPDPRSPGFAAAAAREVIEILRRTRGRAFVLFTSYATLGQVQAIAELSLDYPILVQGTAPRTQLLKQFRETENAVLFATSSFWQGVDVAGEALSCVIIDKLPFASPTDPVTSARIDAIRTRGGSPFDDYQVPLAILTLQQGLGRLIRHRRDRGVLAILDPRLRTKGYGRRFIDSLPPAPLVHELAQVDLFFRIGEG